MAGAMCTGDRTARLGRTRWGCIALGASLVLNLPMLVAEFMSRAGLHLPRRIDDNLSYLIFDFGLVTDVFALFTGLLGIFQGGRSRRAGIAGIVIAVVAWLVLGLL